MLGIVAVFLQGAAIVVTDYSTSAVFARKLLSDQPDAQICRIS